MFNILCSIVQVDTRFVCCLMLFVSDFFCFLLFLFFKPCCKNLCRCWRTWYTDNNYHYTPTRREGAILQSPCPSVHTFVKDVSAATGRNNFIFDTWLWHSDLYRVSPFQAYRTSTSCLPCDLEFFMFAVKKIFVTLTDISASTGRNDFIFDIWLWHGNLYHVSPFQVYRTSTSCLQCDFQPVYNDLYWFIMICAELDVSD